MVLSKLNSYSFHTLAKGKSFTNYISFLSPRFVKHCFPGKPKITMIYLLRQGFSFKGHRSDLQKCNLDKIQIQTSTSLKSKNVSMTIPVNTNMTQKGQNRLFVWPEMMTKTFKPTALASLI